METDEVLRTDVLYIGLTRPTTKFGVPVGAFIFEVCIIGIVFIATGDPLYLLAVAPIHILLYAVSYEDPAIFTLYKTWLATIGRCRNVKFWGSASFSPLPKDKWGHFCKSLSRT